MLQQESITGIIDKAIRTLDLPDEPRQLYEPVGYMFSIGCGSSVTGNKKFMVTKITLFHYLKSFKNIPTAYIKYRISLYKYINMFYYSFFLHNNPYCI